MNISFLFPGELICLDKEQRTFHVTGWFWGNVGRNRLLSARLAIDSVGERRELWHLTGCNLSPVSAPVPGRERHGLPESAPVENIHKAVGSGTGQRMRVMNVIILFEKLKAWFMKKG